jgi:hypothetical protein
VLVQVQPLELTARARLAPPLPLELTAQARLALPPPRELIAQARLALPLPRELIARAFWLRAEPLTSSRVPPSGVHAVVTAGHDAVSSRSAPSFAGVVPRRYRDQEAPKPQSARAEQRRVPFVEGRRRQSACSWKVAPC